MNACDENGLVHLVDKVPLRDEQRPGMLKQAGFTWCMLFFTWAWEERWHPPSDQVEGRLEKTEEHATCLECIALEVHE